MGAVNDRIQRRVLQEASRATLQQQLADWNPSTPAYRNALKELAAREDKKEVKEENYQKAILYVSIAILLLTLLLVVTPLFQCAK